ncbi:PDZ domain-containing protein [Sphingomonas sp. 1P06PA]|uniref:PDZ domain-containing protein n=1 Tax=Sphingomonas sp. 1P06PA TaxID=554121 RepID=UPI0039A4036F
MRIAIDQLPATAAAAPAQSLPRAVWLALGGAGLAALLAIALPDPDDAAIPADAVLPVAEAPVPAGPPVIAPAAQSAPATASIADLVLHGVTGQAAVIARRGGAQMLVRPGWQAAPGIILKSVSVDSVRLSDHGRDVTLALVDASGTSRISGIESGARTLLVAAANGQDRTPSQSERNRGIEFQLALAPREQDGRITGYLVKSGAPAPILTAAGLKPGDVLVSVNGRAILSAQDVAGLAREVAVSPEMRFGYERAGAMREGRTAVPIA